VPNEKITKIKNLAKNKNFLTALITVLLLSFVTTGASLNLMEKRAVDKTKLPQKVEFSIGFQKWITNLKNKGFDISATDFRLKEEVAIYNTRWLQIGSIDDDATAEKYTETIEAMRLNEDEMYKVIFSPNKRQFVDYRNEPRNGYSMNEVSYYGLREDKVLDARILDCSPRANCYFDRGYFLENSNDVFVITEFSRNIDKRDETVPLCSTAEMCTYTIKLHLVNLMTNSRTVYESPEFDLVLDSTIPQL
jgi:hypothetical protein